MHFNCIHGFLHFQPTFTVRVAKNVSLVSAVTFSISSIVFQFCLRYFIFMFHPRGNSELASKMWVDPLAWYFDRSGFSIKGEYPIAFLSIIRWQIPCPSGLGWIRKQISCLSGRT